MRLIDADALMLVFNDWWYSSFGQEETEQSLTIKEAMKAIEDAPTVDAIDVVKQMFDGEMKLMPLEVDAVRRGRWLFPFGDRRYKKCSECGRTFYSIPYDSNYCPNCGARMDGAE